MKKAINPSQKIILTIEGKDYECTSPPVGAVADMEDEIEAAKAANRGGTRALMNFVHGCGLPMDVVRKLSGSEINEVVEAFVGSKNA